MANVGEIKQIIGPVVDVSFEVNDSDEDNLNIRLYDTLLETKPQQQRLHEGDQQGVLWSKFNSGSLNTFSYSFQSPFWLWVESDKFA